MKKILKFIIPIFIVTLIVSCNNNDELNVNKIEQIKPDEFGKLHNEAILELLKHPKYNPQNKVKDNMVLIYNIMSKKYPNYFDKNVNIEKYAEELFGNLNKGYLNYYELIEVIKKSNNIDINLKEHISEQSNINFNKYDYNMIDQNQLTAFNSVKKHSELLWTKQVPEELIIVKYNSKESCDATQQVIIADAAASLILWWNPPASIAAGALSSLLVRQDQIQNYNGGCATN